MISNHVQSYIDSIDFVGISKTLDDFLPGEVDCTVTLTNRLRRTLKPSKKVAHDGILQATLQPHGIYYTENEIDMNLANKIKVMNGQGGAR